jgi:flagellar biosynthesis protein FlhF
MPLEILTGPEVPALLARARRRIGADAVVLSVRRVTENGRRVFEMVAADPATAQRQQSVEAARVTPPAPTAPRAFAPGAPLAPVPQPPRVPQPVARRASAAASPLDAPESLWSLEAAPSLPAPAAAPALEPASAPRRRFGWPFASAPARAPRRPLVLALVGPTGAGKTTTIAKLANHPHAFAGRRVGLLCLDTYRIAGVEQARQYAELSRLPFEVAWELTGLSRAMRRLKDCEVVLIDTPGRGPRASADLRETQSRLLELAPDEVHLVLPAGLQSPLARRIVSAHLPLGVTHLLPTKLDEYPDERGVFELSRQFGLPARWLADGQEVPRDLQLAPTSGGAPARPRVAEVA